MNVKSSLTMVEPKYDPKSNRITNAPQGYQKIKVHLVFACKHDGHCKARLVAGGHLSPDPIDSIYSGVVSTRSLRLSIFLAKLNDMKVWAADIGNAYLEATSKEKLYIVVVLNLKYTATHTSNSQSIIWIEKLRFKMVTKNP